jgi:hypothetical protein
MFRRFFTTGTLAVAVAAMGCDPMTGGTASKPAATAKTTTRPTQARSSSKQVPEGAVAGGLNILVSTANAATPPSPKPASRAFHPLESPPIIKFRAVGSADAPNEADAEDNALASAAEIIETKLSQLDPPVYYRPTPNEVKLEYVRLSSRTLRPPDAAERAELEAYHLDTNRVYVEYDVELSAHQIRDIRTRERIVDSLRIFGVVTVGLFAGFVFLRLDELTRGYLTRWLAIAVVVLTAGAVLGVYLL